MAPRWAANGESGCAVLLFCWLAAFAAIGTAAYQVFT